MRDDHLQLVAQMKAVTVSREYGSGGGEIAARLAQRLNWTLFDHAVVQQVAHKLGISLSEAEEHDENEESLGDALLRACQLIQPTMSATIPGIPQGMDDKIYRTAFRQVIAAAFAAGHVVIVGRGAQFLLASQRDVLHVRIICPFEQRVIYVMRREQLSRSDAVDRIHYIEQGRKRAVQHQYHQDLSNPLLYDFTVNTHVLTLERAVDLLQFALLSKAERLSVPDDQLGPGMNVTPYLQELKDFPFPP
ncbi:cytidylate kinase-like family protein [Dictyobacter arantiisoli]|uniref:Cytidylate kinase n=1 Tax=Dictyobacter arantiisoli TaxID=2014874 RepID=A0A5A5TB23_9CHLR|nr:cytidylate kinase-like family protein [Dictyobacter arantiisoli]GCF08445.1 cytidylate kinase [Dictyobacter arantiisoli]